MNEMKASELVLEYMSAVDSKGRISYLVMWFSMSWTVSTANFQKQLLKYIFFNHKLARIPPPL